MEKNKVFEELKETSGKDEKELENEFSQRYTDMKKVKAFANESDEALTNMILQKMLGDSKKSFGKKISVNSIFLGHGDVFDINTKARERAKSLEHMNDKDQLVFRDMPSNQSFKEEKPIPSIEESKTRMCHGIYLNNGSWERFALWQRSDAIPPLYCESDFLATQGKSGDIAVFNVENPNYNIKENSTVKLEELLKKLMPKKYITLKEISKTQVDEEFPLEFAKVIIVRSAITEKEVDVIEARDFDADIDDDNYTLFVPKGVIKDTCEGDISILSVNKYINPQSEDVSMKCHGIFTVASNKPDITPDKIDDKKEEVVEKPGEQIKDEDIKEVGDFLNKQE